MDWLWPHAMDGFLIALSVAMYVILVTTPIWLRPPRTVSPTAHRSVAPQRSAHRHAA
jgi:hypothetical protein